jgi:hypothetical protein
MFGDAPEAAKGTLAARLAMVRPPTSMWIPGPTDGTSLANVLRAGWIRAAPQGVRAVCRCSGTRHLNDEPREI